MRERITRLGATAFRGVPERFELDLPGGPSLCVFGDNGTGKSTIADILEYYFTGTIEFLNKEGRRQAVRHVGALKSLRTAVEVRTTGRLGGRATFPPRRADEVRRIPEGETFLLRGRTLADFVNKSKGQKWEALSEILGLEAVDALRLRLQTAANSLDREAEAAVTELTAAAEALRGHAIAPTPEAVLAGLEDLCRRAGADPGDLGQLLASGGGRLIAPARLGQREMALSALAGELAVLPHHRPGRSRAAAWNEFVSREVRGDEAKLDLALSGKTFLEQQPRVDVCPLCGQPVDDAMLRALVAGALAALEAAAEDLAAAQAEAEGLLTEVAAAASARRALAARAERLGVELPELPDSPETALAEAVRARSPVDLDLLARYARELERWRRAALRALEAAAPARDREDPLFELGVVVEAARRWLDCDRRAGRARRAADLAERIFTAYQDEQRAFFSQVLDGISARAARLYAKLHPSEGFGNVSVEPMSEKGVELRVEFYGSAQKPPHGVLSESHLNSLAIALFLAMADSFNKGVGFLVLDDVVNSFDVGHRSQLAELLATDFRDWQLLVLTHDEQFYRRIARLAPDWQFVEFTSWSYEEGPRLTAYRTADMLAAAREALATHDRIGAAIRGRRAVEEFLQEACEGLGVPLPFRRGVGNDRREIGEMMKGLRRRLREHHRPSYRRLEPLLTGLDADVAAALNFEAHSTDGRASEVEVAIALDRLGGLIECWTCDHCGGRTWARRGSGTYSCRCGRRMYPPPAGTA